ncbi:MAG: hypothetical protein DRP06_03130 [Candidatus Aenigmatarchaeota archaeon]|nr:MAG: hypothetical protein DRP06_03130 [Candidatus Aenigmarchaeota archaeon]
MGILSFRIANIEGSIGGVPKGELKISSSLPKIKNIVEKDLEIAGNKTKVLVIEFESKTKYEPTNAKINIGGELLYTDKNQEEILIQWKKEKKFDEKTSLKVINYIFKKCLVQSVKIADDLQLPSPMKMPELVKK